MTAEQERRIWLGYRDGVPAAELARREGVEVAQVVRVLDRMRSRPGAGAADDGEMVWRRWDERQQELPPLMAPAAGKAEEGDGGRGSSPAAAALGEELGGGPVPTRQVDAGAQLRVALLPWLLGGLAIGGGLAAVRGAARRGGRAAGAGPSGAPGGADAGAFLDSFWN